MSTNIENEINNYDNNNNKSYSYINLLEDKKVECCLISDQPLDSHHVTMKCGHKFNYEPIFKFVILQKYIYKTYYTNNFTSETPVFIVCPYCQAVQTELLPYYEELEYSKVLGVNTCDAKAYLPSLEINKKYNGYCRNNEYYKISKKCNINNCYNLYVTKLNSNGKYYCQYHYDLVYEKMELEEKKQEITGRLEKLKEKLEKIESKEKKLEKQFKNEEKHLKKEKEKQATCCSTYGEANRCIAILNSGQQCENKLCDVSPSFCNIHNPIQNTTNKSPFVLNFH